MIYPDLKCIFFRIYRTGTSTIEHLLAGNKVIEVKPRHISVRDFELRFKYSFLKFAFVRNPFDLVASLYEHEKHFNKIESFDWFIKWLTENGNGLKTADNIRQTQSQMLKGGVDFIGRFENFENDVKKLFMILKLPPPSIIPTTNKFKYLPYQKYYNKHTQARITDYFSHDLETFKYKFE